MIPSEFTVDGVGWTVERADSLGDRCAETDKAECCIRIADGQCEAMRELAFWHELIHAIFAVRDVKLHAEERAEEMEEEVATVLGPALHAFFLQNAEIQWRYEPPCIT